mmetsp:Transcript_41528/g.101898  ORF Transcript_41528/g.101898 Transcript_41528/m.101898 type:complete len:201 (+) Transcript_41528:1299-1901(+)
MVERLSSSDPPRGIVLEEPAAEVQQRGVLDVVTQAPHLPHLVVPVGAARREADHPPLVAQEQAPVVLVVVGVALAHEVGGNGPEDALHHGEVHVVVRELKELLPSRELHKDAPHGPQVDRVRPASLQHRLGRPVVHRPHERRVPRGVVEGRPEVNELDDHGRGALADDEHVLRLDVRVDDLLRVRVGQRLQQLHRHVAHV